MIKFFRHIRKSLLEQNKMGKYFKYAIGEIVLVVIGILIALQVNNWNQERIQKKELDVVVKRIANSIESDIKSLKLIKSARNNFFKQYDSVTKYYKQDDLGLPIYKINQISHQQAHYFSSTYLDLRNIVQHQANSNAFEALKNSSNFGLIQETDLERVLSTFYDKTNNLKKIEDEHNQILKDGFQELDKKFRNKNGSIFSNPLGFNPDNFKKHFSDFENIVNGDIILNTFFGEGFKEYTMISFYDDLITLGEAYVKMVKNNQTDFTTETKIVLTNLLDTFLDAGQLTVLINGKLTSGFKKQFSGPTNYLDYSRSEKDYLILNYPDKILEWGSPYFFIDELNGRVNHRDFSKYSKIQVEMKGANGGESFNITIKDKYDLRDGSSSRKKLTLNKEWEIYEFDLADFKTLDKSFMNVVFSIVFEGSKGKQVHLKSIKFK